MTTPSPERPSLREAARAVIERWETPLWKDVPATAVYIHALRLALTEEASLPSRELPEDTGALVEGARKSAAWMREHRPTNPTPVTMSDMGPDEAEGIATMLDRLADALALLPAQGEAWRAIEEAPEGDVLLWLPGGDYDRPQCRIGQARSKFGTASKRYGIKRFAPTHFRPLPPPPNPEVAALEREEE